MNSKQIYDAPEAEVICFKIERNLLQASPGEGINPGGDVPGPGNDGND